MPFKCYPPGLVKSIKDIRDGALGVKDAIKSFGEGTAEIIAPYLRGTDARAAHDIVREYAAKKARAIDKLNAAFAVMERMVSKLPEAQQLAITDAAERGLPQPDPRMQPIADALRAFYDQTAAMVQREQVAAGRKVMGTSINDYMAHMYKKPAKAVATLNELATKRPLQGSKGFLKRRYIPFQSDAIAQGLEPVTTNPVETAKLYGGQVAKYVAAIQMFKHFEDSGYIKRINARDPVPVGMHKINDNIATLFAEPNRRGGVSIAGYFVAPEQVANIVNNYLSPGIRSTKFGPIYNFYMGASGVVNAAQLAGPVFHASLVTVDSIMGKAGAAIQALYRGQPATAAMKLVQGLSVVQPMIGYLREGSKFQQEWLKTGSTTPEMARFVEAGLMGGWRATRDSHYADAMWKNSIKRMGDESWVRKLLGVAGLPLGAVMQTTKPLMHGLIPRLKLGVAMELARIAFAGDPSLVTDRVRCAAEMRKIWDHVENRLGELTYDNLMMNNLAKDASLASFRAFGFFLGTVRMGGGAAVEAGRFGKVWSKPRLGYNLSHILGLVAGTAIIGAITHYLLTGHRPKQTKDYFHPGQDGQRWNLPGYYDQLEKLVRHPVQSMKNKINPVLGMMIDLLQNHDFYNTKIRNEDDPWLKQGKDVLKYLGAAPEPFIARNIAEGQGAAGKLLPLVGFQPARAETNKSDAESLADQLMAESRPSEPRTAEAAARAKAIKEASDSVRAGNGIPPDVYPLTKAELDNIKKRASSPSNFAYKFKELSAEDGLKVWDVMTPVQRVEQGGEMLRKLKDTKSMLPAKLQAARTRILKDRAEAAQQGSK